MQGSSTREAEDRQVGGVLPSSMGGAPCLAPRPPLTLMEAMQAKGSWEGRSVMR